MESARVFRVSGKVQGVGFRWSAQEQAQNLALAGWVRNEDDGTVSGLVQGEASSLDAFRGWLKRGPSGARVTSLEWSEGSLTGLRIFTIR